MISPHYKMVRTIITPDDSMPQRFARARHAHRERKQRKERAAAVVIAICKHLVRSHARVVIDVTRFCQSNHGMQQKRSIYLSSGARCELFVRPMKWIASLKRDDVLISQCRQSPANLSGGQS